MRSELDAVIIGAGAFGLYAAGLLTRRGHQVAVIDRDSRPFERASRVNQARLHHGYHYPRSIFTAMGARRYFQRFAAEFPDAVNDRFTKVYAVASRNSYTDARMFEQFCRRLRLPAVAIPTERYFRPLTVTAAFETLEFGFDADALRDALLGRITEARVSWHLGSSVLTAERSDASFEVVLDDGERLSAPHVVNATYAGVNGVLELFGHEPVPVTYEQCEVALVDVPEEIAQVGLTVMDGPFFSLMPFGHRSVHSLTTVAHTPRQTVPGPLPMFPCQAGIADCSPRGLAHCGSCEARPRSAWRYMQQLAGIYLKPELALSYRESLWTVKTLLATSEVDDGRPTLVLGDDSSPRMTTVLSGKVNSLFDLERAL